MLETPWEISIQKSQIIQNGGFRRRIGKKIRGLLATIFSNPWADHTVTKSVTAPAMRQESELVVQNGPNINSEYLEEFEKNFENLITTINNHVGGLQDTNVSFVQDTINSFVIACAKRYLNREIQLDGVDLMISSDLRPDGKNYLEYAHLKGDLYVGFRDETNNFKIDRPQKLREGIINYLNTLTSQVEVV